MNDIKKVTEQVINISKVAMIVIEAGIAGYKFYQQNKDQYNEYFKTILKYMDAMEISESKLTGLQKKDFVLAKAKEVAIDLFKNWDHIADVTSKLINQAKDIYNLIIGKKEEVSLILKTIE